MIMCLCYYTGLEVQMRTSYWQVYRGGNGKLNTIIKLAECITLWGEPERVHAYMQHACISLIRM